MKSEICLSSLFVSFMLVIGYSSTICGQAGDAFERLDKAEKLRLVADMIFTNISKLTDDCVVASGYFRRHGKDFLVKSCVAGSPSIRIFDDFGHVTQIAFTDASTETGWVVASRQVYDFASFNRSATAAYFDRAEAVRSLHFADEKTGWAIGDRGFIMSTKDGKEWIPQSAGVDYDLLDAAFLNKENGWIIGSNFREGGSDWLLLRTRNGGRSWEKVPQDQEKKAWRIAMLQSGDGWILTRNDSILRTTDGGNTWRDASRAPAGFEDWDFSSANTGWLTNWNDVFVTSDGGRTWRRITTIPKRDSQYFTEVKSGGASNVWVMESIEDVLFSSNCGKNWTSLRSQLGSK